MARARTMPYRAQAPRTSRGQRARARADMPSMTQRGKSAMPRRLKRTLDARGDERERRARCEKAYDAYDKGLKEKEKVIIIIIYILLLCLIIIYYCLHII